MNTINVFKRNTSTLSSYRVIKFIHSFIHSFILIPNDSNAILYNRHYKIFGMQYDTADKRKRGANNGDIIMYNMCMLFL